MVLQDQATVIILLLVMAQGLLDLQAAQIITLLHQEDIPLHHIPLVVHLDLEVKDGLPSSQVSWVLLAVLQMDLHHHLHQVLMICTTTGQAGLNQDMEAHDHPTKVKIHRVMALLQELLLVSHRVHLQEALLLRRAHILAHLLGHLRHKANPLILANHHTQINFRYVKIYSLSEMIDNL